MPDPTSYCPGCGAPTRYSWDLCAECLEELGTDPSAWPEPVQFIVRDRDRERKANLRDAQREIQASDFDLYEGMSGDLDEDLMTRGLDEMAPSYGSLRIMLPYAPYDNEADNRAYRQANGIAERDGVR